MLKPLCQWQAVCLLLIVVPAGLTAGSALGLSSERYAAVKPELAKPPGRMVHIGTHRLHIWCLGEGRPSIVLDSGVGGFSLEWTKIETDLAPEFQVCSYDRAGYGWSDPGPVPRTTARIVEELHTLLSCAAVPGPYVLVGHSFGGYNMLRFAKQYPRESAGLVLVDSSHPQQFRYFPSASKQLRGAYSSRGASRLFSRALLPENYPFRVRHLALHLMRTLKAVRTHRFELLDLEHSAQDVERIPAMPDIPLVVVTRGERVWPQNQDGERKEQAWRELQGQLASLTPRSKQVVAAYSGHYVHLDQPHLIEDAIRSVASLASCARSGQCGHRP